MDTYVALVNDLYDRWEIILEECGYETVIILDSVSSKPKHDFFSSFTAEIDKCGNSYLVGL